MLYILLLFHNLCSCAVGRRVWIYRGLTMVQEKNYWKNKDVAIPPLQQTTPAVRTPLLWLSHSKLPLKPCARNSLFLTITRRCLAQCAWIYFFFSAHYMVYKKKLYRSLRKWVEFWREPEKTFRNVFIGLLAESSTPLVSVRLSSKCCLIACEIFTVHMSSNDQNVFSLSLCKACTDLLSGPPPRADSLE